MAKNPKKISVKSLPESEPPKVQILSDLDYPVFCFKHLHMPTVNKCVKQDLSLLQQFISRLNKLCSLGWHEINSSQRHGFGGEKIRVEDIKVTLPPFITADVTHLIAYRYGGNNLPFICLRSHENVLHVIFLELKHGDVYDHG